MRIRILAAMLFVFLAPRARADVQPVFLGYVGSPGRGNGQLNIPFACAVAPNGDVYVADVGNARIEKFDAQGNFLLSWGSPGTGQTQFGLPRDIAIDASGNLYVSDDTNHRVQKFDGAGHLLGQWGTQGSGPGQFEFGYFGSALDTGSGFLYVVDGGNQRVEKFDTNGNFLEQWDVFQPRGIAVAPNGNVYVTSGFGALYAQRVFEFDGDGAPIRSWGGYYGDCEGTFANPLGIAADGAGNVYVVDRNNYRIEKFDADGKFLCKWGLLGRNPGDFDDPVGITIDSRSNIYVADTYGRIVKFRAPDRAVEIDVRPHECPNRLSVSPGEAIIQRRPIQVAVLGSAGFDVTSIDPSTVRLEGIPPASAGPRAHDIESLTGSASGHCGGQGPDGFADQVFSFDEKDVMAAVADPACVTDGETRMISFTAKLKDGSTIGGTDEVVLGGKEPHLTGFADSETADRVPEIVSPNPMRAGGTLSFSYQVEVPCYVSVQMFAMSGRLVGTLAQEFQSAGPKSVTWKGTNEPAGVYFLRASIGSRQISRKVTLL